MKALARAHPGSGCNELAQAEKIDRGYLDRILLLTLLAPDIVEAILDGHQPSELGLPRLMEPIPMEWERQRQALLSG